MGTHHGTMTINQGDTVVWTWTDSFPHTVTHWAPTPTFDSGVLTGVGVQYALTFNTLGTFPYACFFHGVLSEDGTIEVSSPATGIGMGGLVSATWGWVKALFERDAGAQERVQKPSVTAPVDPGGGTS